VTGVDIKLSADVQQQLGLPACTRLDLPLPNQPLPEVTLPTGGKLKALADITKGAPTDCSLNLNLMLASMLRDVLHVLKLTATPDEVENLRREVHELSARVAALEGSS
jgi:hypothetical protein